MSSYKQRQRKLQKELKEKAKREARSIKKIPKTAQQTLPFKTIFPDGICEISTGYYSKTIKFGDVNYQSSRRDHKEAFLDKYCEIINSFDANVNIQITLINSFIDQHSFEKEMLLSSVDDGLDLFRCDINNILLGNIQKGKNNIHKAKYLTFAIHSENIENARKKLNMIETGTIACLRERLRCEANSLDGIERMELLQSIYRHGSGQRLDFDYDLIANTGLTVKDFIAPDSFNFRKESDEFTMGSNIVRASYLRLTASSLEDEFLMKLTELENNLIITINMKSINHEEALNTVKHKLTLLNSNVIEEQKKAAREGYRSDLSSPVVGDNLIEVNKYLTAIKDEDQKMFLGNVLFLNIAKGREQLDSDLFQLQTVAKQCNCDIQPLEEQQEDALASIVPVGVNRMYLNRSFLTETVAGLVPFVAQEISQKGGFFYGINPISHNMIIANRSGKNPNGLLLGMPDGGKSMAAKIEISMARLGTDDDIIILDPDGEYERLVKDCFRGQIIKISTDSNNHINPMDINENYNDKGDPLKAKSEFILSLCEAIGGGRYGFSPQSLSIIDRCLRSTYSTYLQNVDKQNIPTFKDFYNNLKKQNEPEARDIALSLEIYVEGTLNLFAHQTNVETDNRIVCYDIKDIGRGLKTVAMLIVLDQIMNRITSNRAKGRRTRIYIDEFHFLLQNDLSRAFFFNIWKRIRKYGGIPTGITQNVGDLLVNDETKSIFNNSAFIQMLNQSPNDLRDLGEILKLSDQQMSYINNAPKGQGLLYVDGIAVPFINKFPKSALLYKYMTTNPDELAEYMRQEEIARQKAGVVG